MHRLPLRNLHTGANAVVARGYGHAAGAARIAAAATAMAGHAWPTAHKTVAERMAKTTKRHDQRPEEGSDR